MILLDPTTLREIAKAAEEVGGSEIDATRYTHGDLCDAREASGNAFLEFARLLNAKADEVDQVKNEELKRQLDALRGRYGS